MAEMADVTKCKTCGARCCRHVALQIDTPTCKRDYDNIRWFLVHERVSVFVDEENDWLVEFTTPCGKLTPENTCSDYATRPDVCRSYPGADDCEYDSAEEPHKIRFTTAREFEEYLERKGIDWRFKAHH